MADKTLSTIVGGGGGFITKWISENFEATVGSGVRAAITPPAGQKARLTYLRSRVASTANNIEVKVGGVSVKAASSIDGSAGSNYATPGDFWSIGSGGAGALGALCYVEGEIDEVITIEQSGGAMTQAVTFQFMYGVPG